mmetsp:Transcript_15343/g.20597  ORF Transcript_15343/g.20597 Transcript_15343/m.20597 type:complete len:179 (-) Transcript_15343:1330-1866(-)
MQIKIEFEEDSPLDFLVFALGGWFGVQTMPKFANCPSTEDKRMLSRHRPVEVWFNGTVHFNSEAYIDECFLSETCLGNPGWNKQKGARMGFVYKLFGPHGLSLTKEEPCSNSLAHTGISHESVGPGIYGFSCLRAGIESNTPRGSSLQCPSTSTPTCSPSEAYTLISSYEIFRIIASR